MLCPGREIYLFDVLLRLSLLPKAEEGVSLIPCIATDGRRGKIRQVPYEIVAELLR